ncbi:hypothetical protein B7P43_G17996 [Cryptotermes secundus]|uniref:Endonuclease/exonuclease/phosphatase domain-containing protein n=1 Tax=Cryptotermes secundus TaxID=105785 RepID=A0A2J7QVK6_9NEOP|nr:hypothetical protein B7P43_G17996 [Cryptotermes secundus]
MEWKDLENLKMEMQKNEVSVLGVSEVRWKGQGEIRSGDYTVYYSGGERAERVVAIVVHKSVVTSVVKKIVCNDRIIALKLKAELEDLLIMQVFIQVCGSHGLGRRNQRGQMLTDFCERNGLTVTNTWFKKPKRRLYTWKAPGDWRRHLLDYILVKHRFRNSVKNCGRY